MLGTAHGSALKSALVLCVICFASVVSFAGYDTEIAYRVKTEVRPKQKDDSKGAIMSYIITETNQQCLTITLNRTDKKNALTRDM